jgi:hypothetical protein
MAEVEPGASEVVGSTKVLLERVLDDMESLGIVTELAGKVQQQLLQEHSPCSNSVPVAASVAYLTCDFDHRWLEAWLCQRHTTSMCWQRRGTQTSCQHASC